MSFANAIKAWEEKTLQQANTSVTKAFSSAGIDLVTLTQNINFGGYSKGHIANNWQASVGSPTLTATNAADLSGAASLSSIASFEASKAFYRQDNVAYISNGVSYAYRADKLGWPSGEGTNGWVWSGRVGAYGFTGKAINNLKGKYM